MPELVWTLGAQLDNQRLYEYFEEHSPGRGDRYLEALDHSLELLVHHPELAPVYSRRIRRLISFKGTVGIYYSLNVARIFIHAIGHLKEPSEFVNYRLPRE